MLSLHTNAASLSTQNSLGSTNKALSSSMTKLGTGYRVNSAMDDAAGLQIATRLNAQSRGMQVAQKNAQNGISMLQTAEGALNEVTNVLLRIKDLATEAATDTSSADDRTAIKAEIDSLNLELTNIFDNTAFGGRKLFKDADALAATTTFQIGATSGETMALTGITIAAFNPTALTVDTGDNARTTLTAANTQLTAVSKLRSQLGAFSNRLEHNYNNLGNMIQNTEAAKGRIMDVDYASETSNMTSKQMLMQASTSMLKQSNSMSQMVASLLQ